MRPLALCLAFHACAPTTGERGSEATAPAPSLSASSSASSWASSARPPAVFWRWPGPAEKAVYHRDPEHLYNRIHRLVRGGEDRVVLAHAGWDWLATHWSPRHVRDFDQASAATDRFSTMLLRLQPTADNRFRYLDGGLSLAISHLDAPRAHELSQLLAQLTERAGADERELFADVMLQRDLWQLADSIRGGWVHTPEPEPLVKKLVGALRTLGKNERTVAELAWAKAPHGLPEKVREEAGHGWIEWATEGHVHHPESKRSMPFEERVYGIWRTFARFPENAEGKAAAAALERALQAKDNQRQQLIDGVLGKDWSLPVGTTLAGTVHLVHLTKELKPVPTSCLVQVLVRRVVEPPKGSAPQELEVHEASRRALALGGAPPLARVPEGEPALYVLNAGQGHSGLMLASRSQSCLVCHQVRLHSPDLGVLNAPLSWIYDDRTPRSGGAARAIDVSMNAILRAVAGLPKG